MNTQATRKHSLQLRRRERGAVLIVTLLFLVILTMLGVTAMTGTTMEERMAGNTRDAGLALQAAESALRDARRDITNTLIDSAQVTAPARPTPVHPSQFGIGGLAGSCNTGGYRGLCLPDNLAYVKDIGAILPNATITKAKMEDAPSVGFGELTGASKVGATATGSVLSRQPRYFIEHFQLMVLGETLTPFDFYRITARGFGRNPNTNVTLQEVFIAP